MLRSIRSHAIVHLLSPVVTSLKHTTSFDPALASAALLRIVGKEASSPIKLFPALWRGWHLPIGFVLF